MKTLPQRKWTWIGHRLRKDPSDVAILGKVCFGHQEKRQRGRSAEKQLSSYTYSLLPSPPWMSRKAARETTIIYLTKSGRRHQIVHAGETMKAICVPWRYKDLYDDDVCYTYRISGDFFYAITSPIIYVIFFISCLVSLFFKYIYIIGYTMPPMDLKLFLYYNKYYTNTSLCILQSLQVFI